MQLDSMVIRFLPTIRRCLCWVLICGSCGISDNCLQAFGDIRLPKLFCDSMVLQRQSEVHLYGTADPNEPLVLVITGEGEEGRELKTVCNEQGEFSLKFAPPPVGGPYELTLTGEKSKVVIRDVLVGDVWLCAGQSNMAFPISKSDPAEIVAAETPRSHLRLLSIPQTASPQPLDDVAGAVEWVRSNRETALEFSAVGWHFGSLLQEELDVPVGLLHASWGGTKAEAWISMEALSSETSLESLLENSNPLDESSKRQDHSASLYNGMISPLRRFPIKGVVWYQGEANVGRGQQYGTLLPLLIADWRKQWDSQHLPFLFVQLAPFRYKSLSPQALPELWDAQLKTYKQVPRTGMIVISDLGNHDDVHPVRKQEVGRRLGIWALAEVYQGRQLQPIENPALSTDVVPSNTTTPNEATSTTTPDATPHSGPLFREAKVEENRVVVSFFAGEGLRSSDEQPLREFLIAGEDQVFHPANAVIDGDRIVVSSDQVSHPVAVRFSWNDTPNSNLVNLAGLPASPFRTDNFPLSSPKLR
ncbi:MAG: hypothetical protein JNL67_15490 [Planctomycetaceae bacterium]|nr:hypothetical protein [Planctomycetaceae bacterium]